MEASKDTPPTPYPPADQSILPVPKQTIPSLEGEGFEGLETAGEDTSWRFYLGRNDQH